MSGMQVPVKVIIETTDKSFMIEVGTPPASALIRKEAGIDKGAANPLTEKVADLMIEQIIKIAKIKEDVLLGKDMKSKIKEVIGTCNSMGILVEGLSGKDALRAVEQGKFDQEIKLGKTELTAEEKAKVVEERKRLQEEIERRRVEFETKAKAILKEMEGQEKKKIRTAMEAAGVPKKIMDEVCPADKKEEPAGGKKK